jgi:hypothetical protein
VDEFETAIQRSGNHKGFLVAFSFSRGSGGAVEEAARTRLADGPEVVLVTVADVLRVAELVDAAERERADPDRAPDLMGLLSTKQRLAEDFPLLGGPPERAKRQAPSKRPARQLQLGIQPPSRRRGSRTT